MKTNNLSIDFLIIIYKNYDLMLLQLQEIHSLFERSNKEVDYKIIFIDNTPELYRKEIVHNNNSLPYTYIINEHPDHSHDGASQGSAINYGRQYCNADLICLLDSDFFITTPKIFDRTYLQELIGENKAIGTEYYDGEPPIDQCWKNIRVNRDKYFNNIPCCFCMIMTPEILNCDSWITTATESAEGRFQEPYYIETGWRIRKYILDNNIKTVTFRGWQKQGEYGTELPTYFNLPDGSLFGIHFQRGSHRRSNLTDIQLPYILQWCNQQ